MSICLGIFSCSTVKKQPEPSRPNWEAHYYNAPVDFGINGKSYLSVYSQIYSGTDSRVKNLCVTVSMRNINTNDTLYIESARYYDSGGNFIQDYLEKSVRLLPLETLEIIIDEVDPSGGTGGNFLFDWKMDSLSIEPKFEAVMISTSGQQGISFVTAGHRIK